MSRVWALRQTNATLRHEYKELRKERDDYRALLVLLVKVDDQWEFYDNVVTDAIKTLERYNA